jgi:hypothetical protein
MTSLLRIERGDGARVAAEIADADEDEDEDEDGYGDAKN